MKKRRQARAGRRPNMTQSPGRQLAQRLTKQALGVKILARFVVQHLDYNHTSQ